MMIPSRPGLPSALLRLIGGHIGVHAAMAGMRMAAPLLALRLGHGAAAAGVLMAMFAIAQFMLALPASRMVERWGVRPVRIGCVLVASAGTTVSVAWQGLAALAISALCCGAATGVSVLAMQHYVSREVDSDEELRKAFSWVSIAPSLSIFLGPLLAGVCIDAFGFRGAFIALALLPAAAILLSGHPPQRARPVPRNAPRRSLWSLWRIAALRRLLMLNWLMTASWDLHAFMVPVLAHERGFSAASIGALLSAFAFAATFSRLALPAVSRLVREWMLIAGALTAAAALFAVYPLLPGLPFMGVASLLLGVLLGSVQPAVMVLLHQVTPPERLGDALALRLMTLNASAIAMPTLFGAASGLLTVSGVFYVSALLVGVGGGLALSSGGAEPRKD